MDQGEDPQDLLEDYAVMYNWRVSDIARECPVSGGNWWDVASAEAGEETDTGPHTPANLGPGDRQAATHPPLWALRCFDHFDSNITKHRFHNLCRLLFFHT